MNKEHKPISLFPALLKMKCPRCRQGNVFSNPNPFHLKNLGNMNSLCPVCNLNFRPEPGFYFGAAVVSYPMMVIFNLIIALIFYWVTGSLFENYWALMGTLLVATILVAPAAFRYSRIIFLYIAIPRIRSEK